ncbi:MAG: PLP-dependent transferase [Balneolaceae bacterium]|nr:PLP-dependent transferase [Balneolaceae bacterium]
MSRFETRAIHAGKPRPSKGEDLVPPIHRSTVYALDKEGYEEGDPNYTRYDNPNRRQLEGLLADLEEGTGCAAFASGVAAATAVFQALDPGDHVLMPDDVYAGNRKLVRELFGRWGLQYDFVPMSGTGRIEEALRDNTRLVWLETPSNPMLNITDIAAVCEMVDGSGAKVLVDNTFLTPFNQRPLTLGADLVLHSTTKFLGGHSDIQGGAVIAREEDSFMELIRDIQVTAGAVPSPEDCWLLARSIQTLSYRMRAHNQNGMELALFLQNHPAVEKVYYPGLATHAGYENAQKQMSGFGGMISFLLKTRAQGGEAGLEAVRAVAGSRLIQRATSLGGVESTWEHRRSSEGEDSETPHNLVRISVGLEHEEDLKADLERALEGLERPAGD